MYRNSGRYDSTQHKLMNEIKLLNDELVEHIFQGISNLYSTVTSLVDRTRKRGPKAYLKTFQTFLSGMPHLPQNVTQKDYVMLTKKLESRRKGSRWLSHTIKKCIDLHVEISASDPSRILKGLIKYPSNTMFIHECYNNCARTFYEEPYLFSHKYRGMTRLRNVELAKVHIGEKIRDTVRNFADITQIKKHMIAENDEKYDNSNHSEAGDYEIDEEVIDDSDTEDISDVDEPENTKVCTIIHKPKLLNISNEDLTASLPALQTIAHHHSHINTNVAPPPIIDKDNSPPVVPIDQDVVTINVNPNFNNEDIVWDNGGVTNSENMNKVDTDSDSDHDEEDPVDSAVIKYVKPQLTLSNLNDLALDDIKSEDLEMLDTLVLKV